MDLYDAAQIRALAAMEHDEYGQLTKGEVGRLIAVLIGRLVSWPNITHAEKAELVRAVGVVGRVPYAHAELDAARERIRASLPPAFTQKEAAMLTKDDALTIKPGDTVVLHGYHRYTVASVRLNEGGCPLFHVTPAGCGPRHSAPVYFQDVDRIAVKS